MGHFSYLRELLSTETLSIALTKYSGRAKTDEIEELELDALPLGFLETVRRQGFWNQLLPKLRDRFAHLVGLIMRRVVCDASVAFRASFV